MKVIHIIFYNLIIKIVNYLERKKKYRTGSFLYIYNFKIPLLLDLIKDIEEFYIIIVTKVWKVINYS